MRRWNGWGDERTDYPLPPMAAQYLADRVGAGTPFADLSYQQALGRVPPSRLPPHPLVNTDSGERLLHARGQSLPDWIALRQGPIDAYPDGVAYPTRHEQIVELYRYAAHAGASLIPYGGGTSVVGHINPLPGERPVLTIDLSGMDHLLELDETSHLATIQAGARGPQIEAMLNERGFTLGHFPQSFELSTLGGWIATRSCGQQSRHYGRIEELFAGGQLIAPAGILDLQPLPASAAGPDLRQLVLGSEGRAGILTRAVIRVRPLPDCDMFYGAFFPTWETGVAALRAIAQAGIAVSMLRLSDALETETTLALAGKDRLVAYAGRLLGMLGYSVGRCLLVYGVTGSHHAARAARRLAVDAIRHHGGLPTGEMIGRMWRKSRFLTPYLRNTLWETGYALDTLETALPWSKVIHAALAVKNAIQAALAAYGERGLVFAHLSHVYRDGASLYVTYLFRRGDTPESTHQRWEAMKSAASQAILEQRGTISHQHGVGTDHARYLSAEKGALGLATLQAALQTLDPQGLLNPGKLLYDGDGSHGGYA